MIDRRGVLRIALGSMSGRALGGILASGALAVAPSAFAQTIAQSGRTGAALVMFDDAGCPYCRQWHREVGSAYRNSDEGRRAPLRQVMLRGGTPDDIKLAVPVRATPTFVLVQDGREVGRITGYGGADFFWSMLDGLMKKLRTGERA